MRRIIAVASALALLIALAVPSSASNGNDQLKLQPPADALFADAFGNANLVGYYIDGEHPVQGPLYQIWFDVQKLQCLTPQGLGFQFDFDVTATLMYSLYATVGEGDAVRLANFNVQCENGKGGAAVVDNPNTGHSVLGEMFAEDVTLEVRIQQDGGGTFDDVVVLTGTIDRP